MERDFSISKVNRAFDKSVDLAQDRIRVNGLRQLMRTIMTITDYVIQKVSQPKWRSKACDLPTRPEECALLAWPTMLSIVAKRQLLKANRLT